MASNATFADILDVFFPTASESDGGEAIKMMIRPIMQRGMGLASEEAAHHQLGRTINEVSDWLFENGVAPHQICDQGFSMLIAKEIYGLCNEPFPYEESLESLMHTPDIAWQPKHYKGFYDKRMTRILEERKAKNMDERAGILALIKAPQPAVQSDDSDKTSAAPVKNNQPVENDELVENNEAVVSASLPASHESHTMESSPSPSAAMGMPVPTSSRSSVDHNGSQASARRATNPSPAPSAKHQRPLTLTEDGNPAKKMKPENRSRFHFIVTRKGCEDLNSNEEDNAISGHHKANRSDSKVRLHIKKHPLTIVSESSPDDIKREQPASVRVFIKSKSVVEPINRKWSSLRRLAPDSRDDWASMVRAGHGMMSSPYDEPEVYRVIKKQPVEDENE